MGVERKDTGVRYEDVAGIDNVKADIEEVMKMILGDDEYKAIGARPPRVRTPPLLFLKCFIGSVARAFEPAAVQLSSVLVSVRCPADAQTE